MAKTIADYQRDYQDAKARGDSVGMSIANQGANAIRTSQGQATSNASDDIGMVARSGSVVSPSTIMAQKKAPVMSGQDIANTYGLTYDFKTLDKLLTDSISKQYATLEGDMRQNEQRTTDEIYGLQQNMLDAARQNRGSAVTGQALGAYMANDLLATLGWQQETSGLQTQMVQDRQQLGEKKAADLAAATETAMDMANKTGLSMAEIATMLDASATQDNVGLRDALARLYDSDSGLQAARLGADATRYAADVNAASARSYGGGGGYGAQNTSFDNIEDIVKRGSYGDFYYLMAGQGMDGKDIQSLWQELTKAPPLDFSKIDLSQLRVPGFEQRLNMYNPAQPKIKLELDKLLQQVPQVQGLNPLLKK